MQFIAEFRGVPKGAIYPVEYKPGEECPVELLAAAIDLGAVAAEPAGKQPKAPRAK